MAVLAGTGAGLTPEPFLPLPPNRRNGCLTGNRTRLSPTGRVAFTRRTRQENLFRTIRPQSCDAVSYRNPRLRDADHLTGCLGVALQRPLLRSLERIGCAVDGFLKRLHQDVPSSRCGSGPASDTDPPKAGTVLLAAGFGAGQAAGEPLCFGLPTPTVRRRNTIHIPAAVGDHDRGNTAGG